MSIDNSENIGSDKIEIPPPSLPRHIPSLDGIRAFSVLLVIIGHSVTTPGSPKWLDNPAFSSLGNLGVKFFFIISGFLITSLLLRDIEKHSHIRIKTFYIRRILRIIPAFIFYILTIWILYKFNVIDLTYRNLSNTSAPSALPDLIHALTFTENYQRDNNWYYNHLWSLSVEEQFYLIWPALLFFIGSKKSLKFIFIVILASPLIRFIMLNQLSMSFTSLSREFQAVSDSLATGCVLSLFFNKITPYYASRKYIPVFSFLIGLLFIVIGYGSAFFSKPFAYILGATFSNVGVALVIHTFIREPLTITGRILNSKPVTALGTLSYSLYLWQEPFLYFKNTNWAGSFPQNILFSFLAAIISYHIIEKPFLNLKSKFK